MIIYIDNDFKCHVSDPDGTMTAIETDAFDGKCSAYIEGYRYIPAGEAWTRPDGVTFSGEMIAPWRDWRTLDDAQRAYERELVKSLTAENSSLLDDMATLVNEIYNSDTEMMGL